MSVLRALVSDGLIPLLGPRTSIGDVHHGVLYYYMLAPGAYLSGADPLVAVGTIAVAGIAAVAAVWWLARGVGGPAGRARRGGGDGRLGQRDRGIDVHLEPELHRALERRRPRRRVARMEDRPSPLVVVAGLAQIVTMHCHVLGWTMLVPLAGLLVADARRRPPAERRRVLAAGATVVALTVLSYVPLMAHELGSGFSETRAVLDYLAGGSDGDEAAPLAVRLVVVPLRC